ncbi:MAG: holo-ACP synthase [Candidatus Nitrosopumilus sp. bin_32a]
MSIGVDIENISKFSDLKKIKDRKILQKMFTDLEIEYCFQKINPSQHLAARFAAKEAIIKAYNSISEKMLFLNDIEVKNNEDGRPLVNIKNNFAANMDILLSISHNSDNAIAFAVILNKNKDIHN